MMRLGYFGCSLVSVVAMLAEPACSQERSVPLGLGCRTCMATAPGRAAESPAELPRIVPPEVAQIEIALGRLRLVRDHFKIVSRREPSSAESGERSLLVSFHHGQPALQARYKDALETWSLQLDAVAGAGWTREFTADGRPVKVVYSQRPHQPIEIEVSGTGSRPSKMSGLSLWHLMQQDPPGFASYVLPSLERLNPAWNLRQTLALTNEIERGDELTAGAIDSAMIAQCVSDLESSDRPTRVAALECLKQAGLAAHIPLEKQMQNELSVQQRETIERLLDGLDPRSADTPTRLAYWLSGDPAWR